MEIKDASVKFYSVPKSTEGRRSNSSFDAEHVATVTSTIAAGESVKLMTPTPTAHPAPFNHQRVAELKAALAEGRYSIDYQLLAHNMIAADTSY